MFDFIAYRTVNIANMCQLGQFTLDNASNNRTFMEWLERLLHEVGISFCSVGNRIQ
jgi:hypothetical protein